MLDYVLIKRFVICRYHFDLYSDEENINDACGALTTEFSLSVIKIAFRD